MELKKINETQRELVAMDLTVVSAWGLCAVWVADSWWMVALAVLAVLARLLMSLGLYARERKTVWLVASWTLGVALILAIGGVGGLRGLLLPVTKCVDCVWRFLFHDNSLFRGVYQATLHPDEPSIKAASEDVWIFVWIMAAWVYLAPLVWCLWLAFRRMLVKAPTDVFTVAISYGVTALPLCIAVAVGRSTPLLESLVGMLACSAIMIYFLYQWIDHIEPRKAAWFYVIVCVGDACIWASQFETGDDRLWLAYACPALAFFCAVAYWLMTRKALKSVVFALVLGWLIPFCSLGYNVLACVDSIRVDRFDGYPYSRYGILEIRKGDLHGLRDRYATIMSDYESIEYLGQGTPYWAVLRDPEWLWDIYDMERHERLFDHDYNAVRPSSVMPRTWLVYFDSNTDNGEIYGQFQAAPLYSRFRGDNNWRYIPYDIASRYEN